MKSLLIVPKATRRALPPEIGTASGCPRRPQAARSGGKSKRSVSSSKSWTQRGDGRAGSRRIQRFFLGVGIEHLVRPLPHAALLMKRPPDGSQRGRRSAPVAQVLPQEWRRPLHRLVTAVIGGLFQAGTVQRLEFVSPQRSADTRGRTRRST